ncbi:hypothetical protein [Georgenia sp. SUBG003]|uniref:hypothetical protein n=1 Tax=Georgenia sp. SUBG003 TaxID=1497974 RepID=UPI003AB3B6DF
MADGLHSPLRHRLGLAAPARGPRRFGLRRHVRVAPWTDLVEVHWADRVEAYVTPVGPQEVGVALLTSDRRPYADQLAAFPALLDRLGGAAATTSVRGAGPLRQRSRGRPGGPAAARARIRSARYVPSSATPHPLRPGYVPATIRSGPA